MSVVSKIQLPDNTEVDIRDSRIPGVDTTPTSGSSNLVTSGGVYGAMLTPSLAHSSYEGFASNSSWSVHCGLYYRPNDWDKMYTIRFRIHAYVPSNTSVESVSDVTLQCYQGVVKSYYIKNGIVSTDSRAYYQLYFYGLTASGYTAGAKGYIGIYINSANCWSYTTKRQIEYDVIHAEGCTVGLFSSDLSSAEARQSFDSDCFLSSTKYNTYSAGLQETGDTNTTYSVITNDEIEAGTSTTGRLVSAKRLADNYNISTNSSGDVTINIAGASATLPVASSTSPLMDGTAAVGTATKYAREDHVHPSDSSKEDSSNKVTSISSSSTDTQYPSAKCVYNNFALMLPLAGGTISSTSVYSLYLNNSATDALAVGIRFKIGGTTVGSIYCTSGGELWNADNKRIYHSGNSNLSTVDWATKELSIAGKTSHTSGHIYLEGAQADSSTGNTTQLIFGTSTTNHVSITSNTSTIVINPTSSTTTGQIVLGTNGKNTSFSSSGKFGIGTVSPSEKLSVSGNIVATGTITPGSDSRIKDNQREISQEDAFSVIENLKPKTWTWNEKSNENLNGKAAAGLVAQEVKEVLPEAVTVAQTEEFEDFHSLNYNTIQGYELAAIKGLIEEVKSLKAEIAELKKQIK